MLSAAPGPAASQTDLSGAISRLEAGNARAWAAPLASGLARGMTTGFFRDGSGGAPLALGVRVLRLPVLPGGERFVPEAPDAVTWRGETYADPYEDVAGRGSPSVSGSGPGLRLSPRPGSAFERALLAAGEEPADFALAFPAGLGLEAASAAALELTLGLGGRVTLEARTAPTVEWSDALGETNLFGGGILLSLAGWLPLPVDLAVDGALQRFKAGDALEVTGSSVGLLASRRLGPALLYAHGQRVGGAVDLRWSLVNPGDRPGRGPDGARRAVEVETDHDWIVAVGGEVRVAGLRLTLEVVPGEGTPVSGGVAWLF